MDNGCVKGVIDRFEGRFALVETTGGFKKIERAKLPDGAREGAHIMIGQDGIRLDKPAEEAAKKRIRALLMDIKRQE